MSDVYQDLFGELIHRERSIYDVDAFERVLDDRFPDNLILSHDLLEGCYARSALISDVELFETYPARYKVDAGRRHPAGFVADWQIAMWIFALVRWPNGRLG